MPRPEVEWLCRKCSAKNPSLFYTNKKNICKSCILAKCKEDRKMNALILNALKKISERESQVEQMYQEVKAESARVKADRILAQQSLLLMAEGSAHFYSKFDIKNS